MKAAILVELKKPLVIADIELPEKLERGQVLVKVIVSGICGSQLGEIDGAKGPDKYLPHLLGHEGEGIVEEVGPEVTQVKKGDHVVLHWRKGPGIESAAPKYKWNGQAVNAGWVTTFNEKAVVSENRLTVIPAKTDPELAALMGCAITTGFGVVNNDAKLKAGESIAVFGVGGVGLNVVQAASIAKAKTIIAIDIYDNKLEIAKKFGATHTINSTKVDAKEEIFKIVGNGGVDVAADMTGNVKVIEVAYEVTGPKGRTILVGVPKAGDKVSIYTLPLHFGKVLTGSHGGGADPSKDIHKYLDLFEKNHLEYKEMISHRYSLYEINNAIRDIRAGKVVKCMIRM
jgi:S-(hydroxymethyl)glutathione dehydrogenase / alcohol dehydrogenase